MQIPRENFMRGGGLDGFHELGVRKLIQLKRRQLVGVVAATPHLVIEFAKIFCSQGNHQF